MFLFFFFCIVLSLSFTLLTYALDVGGIVFAKIAADSMFLDVSNGESSNLSTGEMNQNGLNAILYKILLLYAFELFFILLYYRLYVV